VRQIAETWLTKDDLGDFGEEVKGLIRVEIESLRRQMREPVAATDGDETRYERLRAVSLCAVRGAQGLVTGTYASRRVSLLPLRVEAGRERDQIQPR
jgi:hypothetical protein